MIEVLLAIGFIGAFFVMMSVRILLKKDGKFRGTCASQSPWLRKQQGGSCGFCGKNLDDGEVCERKAKIQTEKLAI